MVLKLNNNPLISVVVPIYNVEKYLRIYHMDINIKLMR